MLMDTIHPMGTHIHTSAVPHITLLPTKHWPLLPHWPHQGRAGGQCCSTLSTGAASICQVLSARGKGQEAEDL